jgi:hypothetical protein
VPWLVDRMDTTSWQAMAEAMSPSREFARHPRGLRRRWRM